MRTVGSPKVALQVSGKEHKPPPSRVPGDMEAELSPDQRWLHISQNSIDGFRASQDVGLETEHGCLGRDGQEACLL